MMKKEIIQQLYSAFEQAALEFDGVECWSARELQQLLGYSLWQNFTKVIDKAKVACEVVNQSVSDHFIGVNKKVELGSGAQREIEDLMLTRYACYLVAQNGDPRKEQIAFAQTYLNDEKNNFSNRWNRIYRISYSSRINQKWL
jgi:DNA-damage-inducible protein D